MKIDGIFNIKPNIDQQQASNEYYCVIGQEDFVDENGNPRIKSDDDPKIMAKAMANKPSKHISPLNKMELRFYIKTKQNNVIFNPVPIESTVKDKEAFSFINNTCKGGIQFQEVPKSVFDKYVSFLRTKSIKWLNAAQRELK